MSEAMNPRNPDNPMDQGVPVNPMDQGSPASPVNQGMPANPSRPMSQGSQAMAMSEGDALVVVRPGLVTFAAIMMFILAGFQLVWAIVEFVNAAWLGSVTYGTFNGHLWLWGILDLIIAVVAFYAGYDILRGGSFGRVIGVIVAGISAFRWFFYLPAAPLTGVVMIAVDIIIIYGLVSAGEFFNAVSHRAPAGHGHPV
ncbi:MAG: hypothetical protein ACLQUY_23430 [Ktedonobacterales bacterium]